MQASPIDLAALKARMRDTWIAGDFGVIARYAAASAEEFIARLKIKPGTRVLDVACGTGNTAIPAARAGAIVTGADIAPNLLVQARQRAQQEGLKITFDEGDAEQLAYPDASFDLIVTMFGAMFAPRPERVAGELLRVCRPGGAIAMANWTPSGFVGRMFALNAKHVPPPPGLLAPSLWGDEATVRQRLGNGTSEIQCARQLATFHFPFLPAQVVALFRQYFGPTQVAFSKLDASGQATLAADMEALWRENNQANDGTTLIEGEYLEVIANRT